MHPDAGPFRVGEVREHLDVERHEVPQYPARRVQPAAQPSFGEVDLHAVGAGIKGGADVLLALVHRVGEEGIAGIAIRLVLRVPLQNMRGRGAHPPSRPGVVAAGRLNRPGFVGGSFD